MSQRARVPGGDRSACVVFGVGTPPPFVALLGIGRREGRLSSTPRVPEEEKEQDPQLQGGTGRPRSKGSIATAVSFQS